jgi:hypothetical protein
LRVVAVGVDMSGVHLSSYTCYLRTAAPPIRPAHPAASLQRMRSTMCYVKYVLELASCAWAYLAGVGVFVLLVFVFLLIV